MKRGEKMVRMWIVGCTTVLVGFIGQVVAQDVVSQQLRQGFGKNKVRYKDFDWHVAESEHLLLHYEPEFEDLADQAIVFLEQAYDHISTLTRHELSTKPPIVIFKSHYEFQQTNIIQAFLPPGVAGFAEPLRYRMVIPFDGDLDNFRNVLVHELMHIFQYDIVNRGPVKRITNRGLWKAWRSLRRGMSAWVPLMKWFLGMPCLLMN